MPSRLLREGILSSDRVDLLDFAAEVFYRRLMSKVDDYGLFDARPSMLRTSLYPVRVDRVREADIARWIATCVKAGVIALYEHGGKPYLQMVDTRWQTRSEPKHPIPPWGKGDPPQTAIENSRAQLLTGVHLDVDVVGDGDGLEAPSLRSGASPGLPLVGIPPTKPKTKPSPKSIRARAEAPTSATWDAYAAAYERRYKAPPVRNAAVNWQLANLIGRIGADEAPHVAAFYLTHNGQRYVREGHSVGLLLNQCEKLRTEWATSRQITETQARQADQTQARANAFGALINEAKDGTHG